MTTVITMQIYIYVNGGWVDVTADTLDPQGYSSRRGMASNRPDDRLAKTGTLDFSFQNDTGKYLPNGTNVISADWGKGTKVKVVFTYDTQSKIRFYGVVNKLDIVKIPPSNSIVRVSCVDWLDYAAKYPLPNPAIELDKRIDEVLTTVVDAMAIQPLARDFDTGVNVFPTVFNDASIFTLGLSEFSKMALSEMGYIYLRNDDDGETLRAESAASRVLYTPRKKVKVSQEPGFLLQENGDFLLQENGDKLLLGGYTFADVEINNTMTDIQVDYGENLINRMTVTVNPTKIDAADSELYALDSPIYFDPSAIKEFNIQFTEKNSKRLVAALPPEDSYPTALLHFDSNGVDGIATDDSGRKWNFFGVDPSSAVKKLGTSSGYFDGSDSYMFTPSADLFEFGSSDFTVEWWENRVSAASGYAAIRRSNSGGYIPFSLGHSDGTNSLIYITSNGSSWDIANGKTFGAISLNTWAHYSLSRVGDTFYARKNGVLTDSWTSSGTILASTADFYIGGTSTCINGYIDEVRITKGLGRYAAAFTPQTEPYTLSGLIYAAWTNRTKDGTELTGNFDINISYGAAGATVHGENTGTVGGWLTDLKIFGKIVETTSPISDVQEDAASIAAYSHHELRIDQVYQQDFTTGREEGAKILAENKVPLVRVNSVTMNANKDEAHTKYFLEADIGDVVKITEPQMEIDADFFIQGMNWKARAGNNGVIVDFGWTLKKFREALSPFSILFPSQSPPLSRVNFGYQAAVSADNVPSRIWSWWVYFDVTPNAQFTHISNRISDAAGTRGYKIYTTINTRRIFIVSRKGDVQYEWNTTSAFPNTADTWMHFQIAHDVRGGVPRFFCNGSEITSVSEDNLEISASETEVGTELIIGNTTTLKFKDVRIYNGDEVADPAVLAAALYAETPYGDENTRGLLFRTFYAPYNELADYEGASLTEDMKIYDDIGFAVGTPMDEPTGEAL